MADNRTRRAVCAAVAGILQQARTGRGLTLTAVAEKAGISYQMVSFVEEQKRKPTLDTVLRICDALGLDVVAVLRQAKHEAARSVLSDTRTKMPTRRPGD